MPIPDNYQLPVQEKKEFDLLPEDMYEVIISKIDYLQDQPVYNSAETEDRFKFEFTITEAGQYAGRKIWLEVRPTMTAGFKGGQPSWLYKIFCAVNHVELTDDEAKSVTATNINDMEGKGLRIMVKEKKSKTSEKYYNKVGDVLALKQQPNLSGEIDLVPEPEPAGDDDINVADIPF